MRVRRFVVSLAVFASFVSLASMASAQDAQPDGGAAVIPTATTTQTTQPPPPPPVTTTATPPKEDEQEPLRLGRFLELEAQRAQRQRYGSAALAMIGGAIDVGIGIGTFAYVSSNSALFGDDQPLFTFISVFPMVLGGAQILGGLIDIFSASPMERLFEIYAPLAIRTDLTPTQRVSRGEALLFTAAETERGHRVAGAVSSFVVAAVAAGFAIGIGADSGDFPPPNNVIFAASLAGASVISIVQGIGALWWERGTAEVAWEQWHSMHEHVVVHTESKVHFAPNFAPVHGGAVGGLSLVF
jgi:hypothetical protein